MVPGTVCVDRLKVKTANIDIKSISDSILAG